MLPDWLNHYYEILIEVRLSRFDNVGKMYMEQHGWCYDVSSDELNAYASHHNLLEGHGGWYDCDYDYDVWYDVSVARP